MLRAKGPRVMGLSEEFTEKVSFKLEFEEGAEFEYTEKGRSLLRGRGRTIWDKCRKSLHSPSRATKLCLWELSLGTEDPGLDSVIYARRRHSGVVITLSTGVQ